jgi:sugar lactone lactonase YvrE
VGQRGPTWLKIVPGVADGLAMRVFWVQHARVRRGRPACRTRKCRSACLVGFGMISVLSIDLVAIAPASATPSTPSLRIVAGDGTSAQPTAGTATSSALGQPNDVAVDTSGDFFIADDVDNVVEEVSSAGNLSIVAGTGTAGLPTAGAATMSDLNAPSAVALDSAGDLYIADTNNQCIEEVTPSGTLSVFAGVCGARGNSQSNVQATSLHMNYPQGVVVDPVSGDVDIADTGNNVVDQVVPSGISNVIAGVNQRGGEPTPGPATSSNIAPYGLALDPGGNLYIADANHGLIEEVTAAGTLSIFAGTIGHTGAPTPGVATSSHLGAPTGVAFDASGDLYVADYGANVVEEVTPSGTLSVVAGTGTPGSPSAGPAALSDLSGPAGVALDGSNDLFIADSGNNVVEEVSDGPSPSAPVFTAETPPNSVVAGSVFSYTFAASGTPAPTFSLASGHLPSGLTLDSTTGALTGVPTGSATFAVLARNTAGTATTPSITVSVTPLAPSLVPPSDGPRGTNQVAVASDGGFWMISSVGTFVSTHGAPDLGSENGAQLNAPIVGLAASPDGRGYWEVASDGGVFAFGDASFLGSMAGTRLNAPIVGLAASPDGRGYWEVAFDGGVFAFGAAA